MEKTLESPLDCKEIQPVYSEDQPWDFFGGNDAKAETPVLWPPHVKSWLIGKDSCWEGLGAGGEGGDRGWDGWMASLTRWTWVWASWPKDRTCVSYVFCFGRWVLLLQHHLEAHPNPWSRGQFRIWIPYHWCPWYLCLRRNTGQPVLCYSSAQSPWQPHPPHSLWLRTHLSAELAQFNKAQKIQLPKSLGTHIQTWRGRRRCLHLEWERTYFSGS